MLFMSSKNFYKFSEEDLSIVIDFVKNYHLNPTKGSRGRTNQGKRSFGGEIDEWVPGKLLEIAVCRILEKYASGKKLFPDFEIYSNKQVGEMSDPDITEVKDSNTNERKPKVFVEIKRYDPKARWMGPRQHQLKDMEEGYMVHGSIEFQDDLTDKQHDITGSILKKITKSNSVNFSNFSNFDDLVAKIEYVYSFKDLKEKGHFFESGNIIPETDFPRSNKAYRKDHTLRKGYEIIHSIDGNQEITMKWENRDLKLSFENWLISGNCEILRDKTGKHHIYANENTKMFSKIFGTFTIEKNATHRFYFTNTLGKQGNKDVYKSIDDYWFAKKRLDELLHSNEIKDAEFNIKKIAQEI